MLVNKRVHNLNAKFLINIKIAVLKNLSLTNFSNKLKNFWQQSLENISPRVWIMAVEVILTRIIVNDEMTNDFFKASRTLGWSGETRVFIAGGLVGVNTSKQLRQFFTKF